MLDSKRIQQKSATLRRMTFLTKFVSICPVKTETILCSPSYRKGAVEKEKRGVRFNDYGA